MEAVMYKNWCGAALLVIPTVLGIVSVVSGWGFRAGVRLRWRLAVVGIVFFWLSVFNLLGGCVASHSPGKEAVTYWLSRLPGPLVVSFWFIGLGRLWSILIWRVFPLSVLVKRVFGDDESDERG